MTTRELNKLYGQPVSIGWWRSPLDLDDPARAYILGGELLANEEANTEYAIVIGDGAEALIAFNADEVHDVIDDHGKPMIRLCSR